MKSRREVIEGRIAAWETERETNKFGLSHLADRALRVLRDELKREPASTKAGDAGA